MSFVVAQVGEQAVELEAFMACSRCQRDLLASEAWLAFEPLTLKVVRRQAVVVCESCLRSGVSALFGRPHVTTWRAADFLMRCLRASPAAIQAGLPPEPRYRHYRGSSHAVEHQLLGLQREHRARFT
jgi:hypothetical protein